MLIKVYKLIAAVTLTLLVLAQGVIAPISAQGQPATGREGASGPLTGSVTIAPGAVQWYQFKYKYDNSKSDNQASPATVMLKTGAAGCVGFAIETPGTLATPAGEKHAPLGIGSPLTKKMPDLDPVNEAKNADDAEDTNDNGQIDKEENPYDQLEHGVVKNEQVLVWVGGGRATETFYVVVKNPSKATCSYTLSISGSTVSFPTAPAPAPTATPAKAAAKPAAKH
ncbi:MAG: hypothetical protein U0350_13225 [Caldilineaceae bacterium]